MKKINIHCNLYRNVIKIVLVGLFYGVFALPSMGQSNQQSKEEVASAQNMENLYNTLITEQAHASSVLNEIISVDFKKVSLLKAVKVIADKAGLRLAYDTQLVSLNNSVTVSMKDVTVEQGLGKVLENTDLRFAVSSHNHLVVMKSSKKSEKKETHIQQVEAVSGTVTDWSMGKALPGVNIKVKGTTTGTFTDDQGHYELEVVSLQDTLVFSFVGYQAQEVPINGRTTIDISMKTQAISGEEMVVVGYSKQEKKNLTGAVSTVNVEDLNKQSVGEDVVSQLQGEVAGVTILGGGQPGSTPQIRIRGINTFGNNNPLYVVDGMPTTNINDLNPNDIASLQVLKGASASIYGSRASNGVVAITTKKGGGKLKVQYDGYYGVQTVQRGNVWNLNSPQEMANLKWQVYKNTAPNEPIDDPLYGSGDKPVLPDYIDPPGLFEGDPGVDPSLYYVNPYYTDPAELSNFYRITKANKAGTDWFHEIFKHAPTTSHNVSVSGGDEDKKYYFSMHYLNRQGTLIDTYLKRYGLRANSQFNIGNHLRIGENLKGSLTQNPQVNTLSEGGPIGMARRIPSIIPVYDIKGNFAGTSDGFLGVASNPVAQQVRTKNNRNSVYSFLGDVHAELDIVNNLMLRTRFGGSISPGYSHSFEYPQYEVSENNTSNSYSESSYNNTSWTWSNTLNYKKIFNDTHNLTLIAGIESTWNSDRSLDAITNDYFSFDPNYTNLSTGTGTKLHNSSETTYTLLSYIGRINYSFKNKYIINTTIRRDGSSRFLNNKYGWFPSVSGAWRISDENFIQDASLKWLDDLKIRGSYGVLGNQLNVDPANAYTTYGSDPDLSTYDITGSSSSLVKGFMKTRIGNPDARWEKDINWDIGLDATLFDGKLNLTADYYQKKITDLLFNPSLLATAGQATRPYKNTGKMENKGVDVSVSTNFSITQKLEFNGSLTFTSYNNKVLNISNAANYFAEDSRRFNGSNIVRNEVGHPVGAFYGYKVVGFWDTQDEIDKANSSAQKSTGNQNAVYQNGIGLGRFRYADINDDEQVTPNDRTFLGNPNPDFTSGLNLGLNYKNINFSISLYGVYGNDIWNNVLWWTDFNSSFNSAKSHTALYDSWTSTNHNATAPIQEFKGSFSTANVPNSYFVRNGSYLRAKNMQVGYTLPPGLFNGDKIDRLHVYLRVSNLFTITKYNGVDPEVSGSTTDFGVDEGTYPHPRTFLVGINITY